MATTQEGSNEMGNTSKRESGRRSWTPEEEETLLAEHDAPESHPRKRAHSSDPNDKGPTQTTNASVCDSAEKKFKSCGNSKKHKAEDGMQNFCELLREMHRDTNERLKTIAHRIGYQADLGQARKDVFALLQKIPNLSLDDQFDAGDILVKEPERLEYFIGLSEEARSAYIYRLLHAPK